MGYWPRHPRKDLERVLETFDAAGWRIERGSGYYKLYCPCGDHKRTLHLTPSTAGYGRNAVSWLRRQPCYRPEGRRS